MIYKCEYCGLEYEGAECPHCGAPHPVTPTTNNDTADNYNYSTNNESIDNISDNSASDSHTINNYTTNIYNTNSYTPDDSSANSYRTGTAAFNTTKHKNRKRVTETRGFIIFLLIIFFPVGLYLMWKNKVFKFLTRTIITLVYALIIYSAAKNGAFETTDTTALGNDKTVEVAVTNTPTPISTPTSTPSSTPTPTSASTPSPTPTKKPLSKKEKFIKKVAAKTGVSTKTAGNLYDLFYKKMGFKKIDIIQKSDTGKSTFDFNADDYSLKVAFKNDSVSSIKWQFYILYDGKEIKIDKQGVLDRVLVDRVKYYMYATDIIEDNIKTPSTAKFPKFDSSDVGMQRKGKMVGVQGYFDAQNTYGALIRSKYTIEFSVTDLDANIYKAVYIKIDDEIKGKWVELD